MELETHYYSVLDRGTMLQMPAVLVIQKRVYLQTIVLRGEDIILLGSAEDGDPCQQ